MLNHNILMEALDARSMFAISIPGLGFDIPDINIPGINLPGSSKSVADVVTANQKKYKVPGLIAATIKDGKINEIATAGVRAKGNAAKITTSDKFLVASITKSMTSTLAAKLVERGYIKWDTKIIDIFPGLAGKIRGNYVNVTLEQLLSHRAGMQNELPLDLTVATATASGSPMQIRNNYLRSILKMTPVGAVGNYSYSSVDYIVAGAMMETVMRESYEAMMQRLVFTPLGMTSAGFGWPGSAGTVDQPRAHDVSGNPLSPDAINRFPGIYNPSGGVHVSIPDLAKFVNVQFGIMPKKFLTAASIEKLRTPYNGPGTQYGLGWNVVSQAGISLIQHDGTDGNWYASMYVNYKAKTAVLVAANQGAPNGVSAVSQTITDLMNRVIKISL